MHEHPSRTIRQLQNTPHLVVLLGCPGRARHPQGLCPPQLGVGTTVGGADFDLGLALRSHLGLAFLEAFLDMKMSPSISFIFLHASNN